MTNEEIAYKFIKKHGCCNGGYCKDGEDESQIKDLLELLVSKDSEKLEYAARVVKDICRTTYSLEEIAERHPELSNFLLPQSKG